MVKTISKNTINSIRQLHSTKHRLEAGLFIAEGDKIVNELLQTDLKIQLIACVESYYRENEQQLSNYEVNLVKDEELSRISLLQTPNRILALAQLPGEYIPDFSKKGMYLMLDGIRDPGNMGTIIRTAEWFGVKGIICSTDCVDNFNPKVVQGSMGSVFRMPLCYGNLTELISKFKSSGAGTVTGAMLGGISLRDVRITPGSSLVVIGSEAFGIGVEVEKFLDQKVMIPGAPGSKTESLNAAVACGIMLNAFAEKK